VLAIGLLFLFALPLGLPTVERFGVRAAGMVAMMVADDSHCG
jgi:hypothetical protein